MSTATVASIAPRAGEDVGKRRAVDELHDDERLPGVGIRVVDRRDIWMRQARGVPGLGLEPLRQVIVLGELRPQQLDRDVAAKADVASMPDRRHAARSDRLDELVPAGKELPG